MLEVQWKGGMAFEGVTEDKIAFRMDAPEPTGGGTGPSPLEALLCSAAACSAMDVVMVLHKKRLPVNSYRVEIEWTRAPEGELPRPIIAAKFIHHLVGPNLDDASVEQAVRLSDQKYCTIIATLRTEVDVSSTYQIELTDEVS